MGPFCDRAEHDADAARRKRGLIVNVGSFSGAIASPMLAAYSGSKAFVSTWSDALAAEVAPKGVVVQHLNTYFVVRPPPLSPPPSFGG